jgi:ribonuclease G
LEGTLKLMDTAATEQTMEDLEKKPADPVPSVIDGERLAEEAFGRAKKQPLLQRILKNISKGDGKFREVIIGKNFAETRLAVLVDGRMEAFELEPVSQQNWVGAIFKGRIQNLEHGLRAAFVITGQEKNAFLHYWDMLPAANESFEVVGHRAAQREITVDDIPKMYPVGSEIIVQVTKAQMGNKGPRVTTNIALPGRYMVLMPFSGQCGISRKIEDPKERERLCRILGSLALPPGMGVVIRTAGAEKKLKYFVRDLSLLLQGWAAVAEKIEAADGPCLLHREPDLAGRVVRDFLTEEVDRVVTDSPELFSQIVAGVNGVAPRMRSRIHLYEEATPLFQYFNVEKQIIQAFSRRVPLPSGGEIVVEETEALIAIDVNTGSHRSRGEKEDSIISQVNLEAAAEIVRQMRLRNLGGLIIIDFIDMQSRTDQRKLFEFMYQSMAKDTERFQILPISPLGIMQISRQRHSQSLVRDMRRPCPYCAGRGTLESSQATAMRVLAALTERLGTSIETEKNAAVSLRITVHPDVLAFLKNYANDHLTAVEEERGVRLTFAANGAIHRENFAILDENEKIS